MQCTRLVQMIKSWYVHVREETMAPARMVSFMEQHVIDCDICRQDPDLKEEIAKITEMVLPESKIPKAVRQKSIQAAIIVSEDDNMEVEQEEEKTLEEEEEQEEDLKIDDDDSPIPVDDIWFQLNGPKSSKNIEIIWRFFKSLNWRTKKPQLNETFPLL